MLLLFFPVAIFALGYSVAAFYSLRK